MIHSVSVKQKLQSSKEYSDTFAPGNWLVMLRILKISQFVTMSKFLATIAKMIQPIPHLGGALSSLTQVSSNLGND